MENKTQSIKISSELYKILLALAKKEGRFVSHLLDKAIQNYLISKKLLKG